MALVTLEEMKNYLRMDTADDDGLIGALLTAAGILCADIARLPDNEWVAIESASEDEVNGTIPTDALRHRRDLMRVAILYTVGYLYEHRENANHHELTLTLRNLLFSIREGVI